MAKPGDSALQRVGGLDELKKRLLFVLFGLLVFRIGAHIPVPGLDPVMLAEFFRAQSQGIIGLFNMFSGGALERFTVFALGIMPYISAAIIMQLMSAVVPSLAEIKKEGEAGRRKITQYTRYGTFFLALFQAVGVTKFLVGQGIALDPGFTFYFVAVVTLVTGTMFLMWLGEQITERGIGNGISLIIFAGIVSGFPSAFGNTLEQVRQGQLQMLGLLLMLLAVAVVTAVVVFIERGQRRITINYAKRQQGRRMYAAQTSHLPLKINMAGVIPAIFATSIILFPATIAQWFGSGDNLYWLGDLGRLLGPNQPLNILLMAVAIVFFCFFYTAIVFNPKETADNLKRSGALVPGIRPGEQTARYIDNVMTRLTLIGAIYITSVALLPQLLSLRFDMPFYFGGTSLLIVVVVVMDFMAQVSAQLMSHRYESLMKKANLKGGGGIQPPGMGGGSGLGI